MGYRDISGIAVAIIAVALTAISLAIDALAPPSLRWASALDRASARVLESQAIGEAAVWRDRDSGMAATIVAADVFRDPQGRWCRPYTVKLSSGETFARVACRDGSGGWTGALSAQAESFDRWLDRLTDGENQQIAGTLR
jgi:17 kDa common-antigen outer membrane protein